MRNKYLILIITVISILAFNSCSDKNKELFNPNLDGEFNFSLSNKGYTVEEMVKRESQIKVDSGSSRFLLKFETDEIKKDTSIQNFVADVFLELIKDTTFVAKSSDTLTIESIVGRDSVEIMEADITDGNISYEVANYTNKTISFKLYFLGFTKLNNGNLDTLNITFNVPPGGGVPYKQTIVLSGYNYKVPPNQPFQGFIKGFWIKGLLTFGGGSPGDSIHVFTKVSNIAFSRIKGKFKPVPVGGDRPQTFVNSLSKNISDFIKGVTFDSVDVIIKASSTISGLDLKLNNFSVRGIFKDGSPSTILHFKDNFGNWQEYFDTLISASQTTIFKFDQSNTDINKFLTKAPDSIRINSNLVLNPSYKVGEVRSNDSVKISFLAEAWSKWRISDATFNDSTEIEIGKNDREKFDRAKEGNLFLDVVTTIPMKAELVAYVVDSNKVPILVDGKRLYLTKNNLSDSVITMNAASVDAEGNVVNPATTNLVKVLTKAEIAAMKNAYYIMQRYTLNTSNSQIVYISSKQDVKISIRGSLKLTLTSDDLK